MSFIQTQIFPPRIKMYQRLTYPDIIILGPPSLASHTPLGEGKERGSGVNPYTGILEECNPYTARRRISQNLNSMIVDLF